MDDYSDYVSIGEIAKKLDVSKPRIHQIIDLLNAKNETVRAGRVSLISPDLADRIEKRQLAGKEHIESSKLDESKRVESLTEDNNKLTNELITAKTSIQVISHDNDVLKASNSELKERVSDLQKQLDSKDKQIQSLNTLVDQSQKLQLKQQLQLEHKQGFWSKLFNLQ